MKNNKWLYNVTKMINYYIFIMDFYKIKNLMEKEN